MTRELEELDQLLAAVAADPAIAALIDATGDAGHASSDQVAALEQGALEVEEATLLRRHILFCPVCSDFVVHRASAEVEAAVEATPEAPATSRALPTTARLDRRAALKLGIGLGVLAASGATAWWILEQRREQDLAQDGDEASAARLLDLVASLALRDGVAIEGEEPVLGERDEVAILAATATDRPLHLYVLAATADRRLVLLHPTGGEASRALASAGDLIWLPAEAAPAATPRRRGFSAAQLGPGPQAAIFVLASERPIAVLEGDVAERAAMPRLAREWMSGEGRLDRTALIDVARRARAAALAAEFNALYVEIEPH